MTDVAKVAKVSLATVSAAINQSAPVSEKTRARIDKAIRRVGYKTNAIARSLKTGTTIGLMVADITNPFFTTAIHAIQEVAHRYEGYRRGLREAGIAYESALVGGAHFGADDGYHAANKLLSLTDRLTAIFACNNLSGLGLMRALHEAGLRCPDDVAVACFDDFDWAEVVHPRLTTIAQPTQAIGVQAMTMLLERMRDDAARSLPARLVRLKVRLNVRDSSRPPER